MRRIIMPGDGELRELTDGDLVVLKEIPWASNYTYLARLDAPGSTETLVVYKPQKGEAPLWDFPGGSLCRREVAAYLVSEAGGWAFVPPTVLRDGPLGLGAVQRYIGHDPQMNAFDLLESHLDDLRRIAIFDLVVNNADRKAGHVLLDASGKVWAVDHGICFHSDPKLRTVLWDFVGTEMTENELEAVRRLRESLSSQDGFLSSLITSEEVEILGRRADRVLKTATFPEPGAGRHYPWPPV